MLQQGYRGLGTSSMVMRFLLGIWILGALLRFTYCDIDYEEIYKDLNPFGLFSQLPYDANYASKHAQVFNNAMSYNGIYVGYLTAESRDDAFKRDLHKALVDLFNKPSGPFLGALRRRKPDAVTALISLSKRSKVTPAERHRTVFDDCFMKPDFIFTVIMLFNKLFFLNLEDLSQFQTNPVITKLMAMNFLNLEQENRRSTRGRGISSASKWKALNDVRLPFRYLLFAIMENSTEDDKIAYLDGYFTLFDPLSGGCYWETLIFNEAYNRLVNDDQLNASKVVDFMLKRLGSCYQHIKTINEIKALNVNDTQLSRYQLRELIIQNLALGQDAFQIFNFRANTWTKLPTVRQLLDSIILLDKGATQHEKARYILQHAAEHDSYSTESVHSFVFDELFLKFEIQTHGTVLNTASDLLQMECVEFKEYFLSLDFFGLQSRYPELGLGGGAEFQWEDKELAYHLTDFSKLKENFEQLDISDLETLKHHFYLLSSESDNHSLSLLALDNEKELLDGPRGDVLRKIFQSTVDYAATHNRIGCVILVEEQSNEMPMEFKVVEDTIADENAPFHLTESKVEQENVKGDYLAITKFSAESTPITYLIEQRTIEKFSKTEHLLIEHADSGIKILLEATDGSAKSMNDCLIDDWEISHLSTDEEYLAEFEGLLQSNQSINTGQQVKWLHADNCDWLLLPLNATNQSELSQLSVEAHLDLNALNGWLNELNDIIHPYNNDDSLRQVLNSKGNMVINFKQFIATISPPDHSKESELPRHKTPPKKRIIQPVLTRSSTFKHQQQPIDTADELESCRNYSNSNIHFDPNDDSFCDNLDEIGKSFELLDDGQNGSKVVCIENVDPSDLSDLSAISEFNIQASFLNDNEPLGIGDATVSCEQLNSALTQVLMNPNSSNELVQIAQEHVIVDSNEIVDGQQQEGFYEQNESFLRQASHEKSADVEQKELLRSEGEIAQDVDNSSNENMNSKQVDETSLMPAGVPSLRKSQSELIRLVDDDTSRIADGHLTLQHTISANHVQEQPLEESYRMNGETAEVHENTKTLQFMAASSVPRSAKHIRAAKERSLLQRNASQSTNSESISHIFAYPSIDEQQVRHLAHSTDDETGGRIILNSVRSSNAPKASGSAHTSDAGKYLLVIGIATAALFVATTVVWLAWTLH